MFPQDPCIIYIEKECKVQVSVLCLCTDCRPATHISLCWEVGRGSHEIVSKNYLKGKEEPK